MHGVTIEELSAILDAPRASPPAKLPALDADMDTDELLEIAAEEDERGPLATIGCLLEALRVRHHDDDTTLAILAAVEYLHLPVLLDFAKGE